jgi:hypothetical protein
VGPAMSPNRDEPDSREATVAIKRILDRIGAS